MHTRPHSTNNRTGGRSVPGGSTVTYRHYAIVAWPGPTAFGEWWCFRFVAFFASPSPWWPLRAAECVPLPACNARRKQFLRTPQRSTRDKPSPSQTWPSSAGENTVTFTRRRPMEKFERRTKNGTDSVALIHFSERLKRLPNRTGTRHRLHFQVLVSKDSPPGGLAYALLHGEAREGAVQQTLGCEETSVPTRTCLRWLRSVRRRCC